MVRTVFRFSVLAVEMTWLPIQRLSFIGPRKASAQVPDEGSERSDQSLQVKRLGKCEDQASPGTGLERGRVELKRDRLMDAGCPGASAVVAQRGNAIPWMIQTGQVRQDRQRSEKTDARDHRLKDRTQGLTVSFERNIVKIDRLVFQLRRCPEENLLRPPPRHV